MSWIKKCGRGPKSLQTVIFFVSLSLNLYPCMGHTAPGALDQEFGSNGIVTTTINAGSAAYAMAIQPDGKIVVAGTSRGKAPNIDFTVARYDSKGNLDTTFGDSKGWVATNFAKILGNSALTASVAYAVAIQPKDKKIVVAGMVLNAGIDDFALVRYNIDGKPDESFGIKGGVQITDLKGIDTASSVAIQPDERIVVVGTSYDGKSDDIVVARYLSSGELDKDFGGSKTGWVTTDFGTIFGKAPTNDIAYAVAILSNGDIMVAGESDKDIVLARYDKEGTLNKELGNGKGVITTDFNKADDKAHAIAIQPDGNIVVAGMSYNGADDNIVVARYTPEGNLDKKFSGGQGWVATDLNKTADKAHAIAIQPDGNIVVAGESYNGTNYDFALLRYTSDGELDTKFGNGTGWVTTDLKIDELAYAVAVQSDGKIAVAGSTFDTTTSKIVLARYLVAVEETAGTTPGGIGTTPGGTGAVTVEEPEAAAGETGAKVDGGEAEATSGESAATGTEGGGGCSLLPSLR